MRTGDGREHTSVHATIWRWREAFQHDFAARMDWCVADAFEKANHNSVAVLRGVRPELPVVQRAPAGARVQLDASGSTDPDGDALRFR